MQIGAGRINWLAQKWNRLATAVAFRKSGAGIGSSSPEGILTWVIAEQDLRPTFGTQARGEITEKLWRKRVGVEPTGNGIARRPPVLKTGTITGPHALPSYSFCVADYVTKGIFSRIG